MLKQLNIKGIAPTMPGSGYSDIQIDRRIVNYPKDDVLPILKAENVNEFFVDGFSLGTAHALSIARYFGLGGSGYDDNQCVGVGLNCPYLSTPICAEFQMRCDADDMWLVRHNDTQKWSAAWNYALWDLLFYVPYISPPAKFFVDVWPKWAQACPEQVEQLMRDQTRTVVRGSQGQGCEAMHYTAQSMWGFDPREVNVKNVCVWYAQDDCLSPGAGSPPEHGEWLAKMFQNKQEEADGSSGAGESQKVRLSIRAENVGRGHMTYAPSKGAAYTVEEETIPQRLLQMIKQTKAT